MAAAARTECQDFPDVFMGSCGRARRFGNCPKGDIMEGLFGLALSRKFIVGSDAL